MLKFSVLLPTRNRLEYLRYAITSVIEQDYDNWEIIVSDNFSEENIKGYIDSLNDKRIKYFKTSSFIPVTDNWNNALEHSSGDYVIMLGDDDCLMKGYFKKSFELINQYQFPDLLYTSALNYVYPEVFKEHPHGLLNKWGNASFFEGKETPFLLEKQEALDLAKETMNFKVMFNFNAQFALISSKLIHELQKKGPFYQSPYPDYYSMTVLFLNARSILAVPDPLVIIGTTPKSFGYYYFNNKEKQGNEFLKNLPDEKIYNNVKKYLMPGTSLFSSWLLAMETVKYNYGEEFKLKVNYRKYRFLQVIYHYKLFASQEGFEAKNLIEMAKSLFWWEKLIYLIPFYLIAQYVRMHSQKEVREGMAHNMTISFSHPQYTMKRIEGQFYNILKVFESMP